MKDDTEYIELTRAGYGDDSIYDQSGNLWVVFRSDNIFVKSDGKEYTEVKRG